MVMMSINATFLPQNQTAREPPDKAFKLLDNCKEEMFNKDFLFYLLVAYRLDL